MALIKIKRGTQEAVSRLVLAEGELALALDTGNLYGGLTSGAACLNPTGGTSETAEKLKTPRSFSITGDASAPAVNFDGTENVQLQLTLANIAALSAGTYCKVTVNSKGQVTAGTTLEISDLPDNIPTSMISGLGTAAAANTGTASGNVPVIQSNDKLLETLIPDLSGTYVPITTLINGKPLSGNVTLSASDVGAIPATAKGAASGVAELDSTGKVPASQLPAYVDDVVDAYVVSGAAAFSSGWLSANSGGAALTPDANKIYVVLSAGQYQNLTFRWSGTVYVEISPSLALGETASTAFPGDKGKVAYDHAQVKSGNPHGVTAEMISAAPASHVDVIASASTLGHIKASGDFSVAGDGTMSIASIDGGTFE